MIRERRVVRRLSPSQLILYLFAILITMPLIGNHALWLGLIVMSLSRTLLMAQSYPQVEAKAGRPI